MELNNTKIENPEVLIQALITRLEAVNLELDIAKYRLNNIQFILNAEVKVQHEGKIENKESVEYAPTQDININEEVVDIDEEFEIADEQ